MTTKTVEGHIETAPDTTSMRPRIAGHRITVQDIVIWHERMGKGADEIAAEYDLTFADELGPALSALASEGGIRLDWIRGG